MPVVGILLLLLAACSGSTQSSTDTGASSSVSGGGVSGGSASGGGASAGATGTGTSGGGASSSTTGAPGTTGGAIGPCTLGASASLPACTTPDGTTIDVPEGCKPTVDGAYKAGEWADAACVTVGSDPVYVKASGTTLYLAWSMTPTCGCPAELAFNPNNSLDLDGTQFVLGIFDDPNNSDGDASEIVSTDGGWSSPGAVSSGILIRNPPGMPALVTYELAVPFSKLGLTPGTAHSIGFGLQHLDNGVWPAGLSFPPLGHYPSNPSDWGQLSGSW